VKLAQLTQTLSLAQQQQLSAYLHQFMLSERCQRLEQVLTRRSRYITVAVENLCDSQNLSAIIRSCECFGFQDLHSIEADSSKLRIHSNVVRGAAKWLSLHRHRGADSLQQFLQSLRQRHYRIAATALIERALPIDQLPLDQPVALVFGSEHSGCSAQLLQAADYQVMVPMFGFTQSFNVSVAAALSLQNLRQRLEQQVAPATWQLCEAEKTRLRLSWSLHSVASADELCQRWLKQQQHQPLLRQQVPHG